MMMKEKVGEVFSIAMDNPAIPGCTISKAVHDGANDIICFSLARNTDISAEIYPYHKLIIMAEGVIEIYGADGFRRNLHTSESIITLSAVLFQSCRAALSASISASFGLFFPIFLVGR